MRTLFKISRLLLAVGSALPCLVAQNDIHKEPVSKSGNHYYKPNDFVRVPASIRTYLNKRHCLIPQDSETNQTINIVSGEFARAGQKDWVAYCSVGGRSKIVVIWGGPAKCSGDPFGLNEPVNDDLVYKDADPQQMGRAPTPGIFWRLETIPQRQVVAAEKQRILSGKLLKSPTHDALQRSSDTDITGTYCTNGRWKGLWYAD